VEIKEQEPLQQEFIDNTFWSLPGEADVDVDALVAELEA